MLKKIKCFKFLKKKNNGKFECAFLEIGNDFFSLISLSIIGTDILCRLGNCGEIEIFLQSENLQFFFDEPVLVNYLKKWLIRKSVLKTEIK